VFASLIALWIKILLIFISFGSFTLLALSCFTRRFRATVLHQAPDDIDDIVFNISNINDDSASNKWTDLFCRATDREDGTPRFSLKGVKSYLYEYAGYSGGHPELDQIIKLLKTLGIKRYVSGADSPMNVRNTEYVYYFEDGGFEIYSGNYFFGPPAHGAFVVGFKAFRWLLNQLGIKQPRRFKNELSTDFTVAALPRVPNEVERTRETSGIDNWALHKLLVGYIANKEKPTQS
jgi:hypothetical protein